MSGMPAARGASAAVIAACLLWAAGCGGGASGCRVDADCPDGWSCNSFGQCIFRDPADGDTIDGDADDQAEAEGDTQSERENDRPEGDPDGSDGDTAAEREPDQPDGDEPEEGDRDADPGEDDRPGDTEPPIDGDATDGGFPPCSGLPDCPGDQICDIALGRCETRSSRIVTESRLVAFHPPAGAPGDLLVIDGQHFFWSIVGNFRVQIWIGSRQIAFAEKVAWDENRLLIRVPAGASGTLAVQNEGGLVMRTTEIFAAVSDGVLACDGTTPAATGVEAADPTSPGPYAAGYLDRGGQDVRIFYPARCGSVRRPAVPGSYPLVAILHGNGAGHVNYEYLGQLLASNGFIAINPPSTHTNQYDEEVIDLLFDTIDAVHRADLSGLHPALAGLSTDGRLGFICHSRGCGRMQELLGDHPSLSRDVDASVFLGPANDDTVVPGHFLAIGATEDGQSFPMHYNGAYGRQPAPRWKVVIQGGNHSLFADAKVYYGMDGVPSITRHRQLTIVASFVIPLMQRAFGRQELFAGWLDSPPPDPDYVVTADPGRR